ncbi:MAG: hypothetical protein C4315_11295 [Chloroflexota bacterium]
MAARAVFDWLNARLEPRAWSVDPAHGLPPPPIVVDMGDIPECGRSQVLRWPGPVDLAFPWPVPAGQLPIPQVPVRIKRLDDLTSPGRLGVLVGLPAPVWQAEPVDDFIILTVWPDWETAFFGEPAKVTLQTLTRHCLGCSRPLSERTPRRRSWKVDCNNGVCRTAAWRRQHPGG